MTPGPAGFFVIAILVVALTLLAADMLRRVRRARYRDEANEALDAEQAAAEAAARGEAPTEAPLENEGTEEDDRR